MLIISLLIFFLLGSGKSAMAATVGIESDFPYVKIVSNFTLYLSIHEFDLSY